MKPTGWLPHPILSALLALVWRLLQQSLAPPQLITAAVLGWGVPRLLHGFLGETVRVRSWPAALRLAGVVLWDILVANFTVARLVLWPGARPQPAWLTVPLDLGHPTAITLLATIITTTPGTVSCIVDEARRQVLVHALDGSDAAGQVRQIKLRYEQALKEIFEP
ncbi:MAG: Na+/H+ antiporter subunit E [Burkholderiaceae bacterium]|nr:Na+/H+ antiporter subunit E [Burkholderiaceae bacterium]